LIRLVFGSGRGITRLLLLEIGALNGVGLSLLDLNCDRNRSPNKETIGIVKRILFEKRERVHVVSSE